MKCRENPKINCVIRARHIKDGKTKWSLEEKYQTTLVTDGEDLICEVKDGVLTGKIIRRKSDE